jgi:hypothetical protein
VEDLLAYEFKWYDEDVVASSGDAATQFSSKIDWFGLFVPKWNANMVGQTAAWALGMFYDPILGRGVKDPIHGDGHGNSWHTWGHKLKSPGLQHLRCVKAADKSGNIVSWFGGVHESADIGTYMGAWMEMMGKQHTPWSVPKMSYTASLDLKDMSTVASAIPVDFIKVSGAMYCMSCVHMGFYGQTVSGGTHFGAEYMTAMQDELLHLGMGYCGMGGYGGRVSEAMFTMGQNMLTFYTKDGMRLDAGSYTGDKFGFGDGRVTDWAYSFETSASSGMAFSSFSQINSGLSYGMAGSAMWGRIWSVSCRCIRS